jgi:hypothetical protein
MGESALLNFSLIYIAELNQRRVNDFGVESRYEME